MPDPGEVSGTSRVALHREIEEGVPFRTFEDLQDALGLPQGALLDALRIPRRTFERRRDTGRFDPVESERVVRLRTLVEMALEVFDGDADAARAWWTEPNLALGQVRPLDLVSTGPGAREVEDLLLRIEAGVGA